MISNKGIKNLLRGLLYLLMGFSFYHLVLYPWINLPVNLIIVLADDLVKTSRIDCAKSAWRSRIIRALALYCICFMLALIYTFVVYQMGG